MELRILCKHLVADELNGKFTVGEDSADIVGITLPRVYEQHDLSQFSFRITAVGESSNAAVQILKMDSFDEKSVHLLWNVTSNFTVIPEEFTLFLTGVNFDNSVTIKFKSCPISVNPDETWEVLPSPELSEQLLNQTQSEVQKAIDAANRAEKASQTPAPAEIYPASETNLGGVKVDGKTITACEDGTISAFEAIKETQNLAMQIAHPNNFLIYDDLGKPSVMVAIPKFYLDEVIDGASHTVHPAFIINGVEHDVIYISKYQNIVENERAYSLPMKAPKTNITLDQAWNYCKNKGAGWHLMTNAEWAAIALWCKKNGTQPKGNNNYGKDISEGNMPQKAIAATYGNDKKTYKTLTGSGSVSWYHDGTEAGIADLNGNIWEFLSGAKIVDGEIRIFANNDAADWNNSEWKAILPNGTLVAPGTENTLKYTVNTSGRFTSISTEPEAHTNGIELMESLTLISHINSSADDYSGNLGSISLSGEKILRQGGSYSNGKNAGLFALGLSDAPTYVSSNVGFRSAYYNPSTK